MKVSIFGLGYVGCVGLGCMARNGHEVIGVDVNPKKVELINNGKPTVIEREIDEIINNNFQKGRISATTDHTNAVMSSAISFLCVGTPNDARGQLNLEHIYTVAKQIGTALKKKRNFHIIVIRSTVPPGTSKKVTSIIEEESDKNVDVDFSVVSNPEFLREGSAVDDYYNPPFTVIGSSSDRAVETLRELYKDVKGELIVVSNLVAETIKLVNNTFHALKISFANEIGNICKRIGIDSHSVMDLFCRDKRLNLSSYYLKPGFAYGGSCLPKDLKALVTLSHDLDLQLPILENIERSNAMQKDIALQMIMNQKKGTVGILGLSFKKGTDDLRNSPTVDLVESLLGKGYNVLIYDPSVHISKFIGTNKDTIESKAHVCRLIRDDLNSVIDQSEIIVITQFENKYSEIIEKYPEKVFIDFVKVTDGRTSNNYHGICW